VSLTRRLLAASALLAMAVIAGLAISLWPHHRPGVSGEQARQQEQAEHRADVHTPVEAGTDATALSPRLDCIGVLSAERRDSLDAGRAFAGWIDRAVAVLADSEDPEHVLFAALMTRDRDAASFVPTLERAARMAPENPLIGWHYVEHCVGKRHECSASAEQVERQAMAAEPGNGALLGLIAAKRWDRADKRGSLAALEAAAAAAYYDDHWIEGVMLIERAIRVVPAPGSRSSVVAAMDIAAALPSSVNLLVNACGVEGRDSVGWVEACTAFGYRLEREAIAFNARMLGLSMQLLAAENGPDTGAARTLAERQATEMAKFMDLAGDRNVSAAMELDESLARRFLDLAAVHGELGALERIRAELARLLETLGYRPCDRP